MIAALMFRNRSPRRTWQISRRGSTTTKIAFTTEAVTCRPSDSALPPTFMPSTDAMVPMIKAMKGP
jgi:hypothetical protein